MEKETEPVLNIPSSESTHNNTKIKAHIEDDDENKKRFLRFLSFFSSPFVRKKSIRKEIENDEITRERIMERNHE